MQEKHLLKVQAAAEVERRLQHELSVANPITLEGKGGLKLRVPKEIADELAELRAFKATSFRAAQAPGAPPPQGPPPPGPPPAFRSGFAPMSSV